MAYEQLATDILRLVGGKQNVRGLVHCVSRLRFTLADLDRADTEAIKALTGVLGVNIAGEQYQVIVGNKVTKLFGLLESELDAGIADPTLVDEDLDGVGAAGAARAAGAAGVSAVDGAAPKPKRKVSAVLLDFISAVMLPVIPFICACGLVKALNVVLNMMGVLAVDSGMYTLLAALGDAAFYFIPALFGFNAFKKLGGTPFLGLVLGLALCYPTINGTDIDLFGYVVNTSYTGTLLPVILGSILGANLEKLFNRVLPEMFRAFFGPALVLLITFPLVFAFIGPASNIIGAMISMAFNAIYNISPVLCGALIGGLWQVFVLLGLHMMVMAFPILDVMQGIPSPIAPLTLGCGMAVATAAAVYALKTRDAGKRSDAVSACVQAAVFGITEPTVYGVLAPNPSLLLVTCAGGAVGGVVAALMHVQMYFMSGMGIVFAAWPSYLNPAAPNLLDVIIPSFVSVPVTLVLGLLLFRGDDGKAGERGIRTKHMKKREARKAEAQAK